MASQISKTYYHKPLVITYSGGKDSDVLVRCAEECLGTDFEVVNSHTTVDAPQTVQHIRARFKELENKGIHTEIIMPPLTMWQLIEKKGMPPTRLARYCCKVLKETTIPNRVIVTGVRASESAGRQGRDAFTIRAKTKADAKFFSLEHAEEVFKDADHYTKELKTGVNEVNAWDCTLVKNAKENGDIVVHAIYEWTDADIWEFIKERNIDVCELYGMGYDRVGCIGCPEGSYKQKCRQFQDFPAYKINYIKAFDRMLEKRRAKGLPIKEAWSSGEEVFNWWIEEYKHNVKGQMSLEDFLRKEM